MLNLFKYCNFTN